MNLGNREAGKNRPPVRRYAVLLMAISGTRCSEKCGVGGRSGRSRWKRRR